MLGKISELEGHKLMCHCDPGEPCHADVLIEEFERQRLAGVKAAMRGPPDDEAALHEAARRRALFPGGIRKDFVGILLPTLSAGVGPPPYVSRGGGKEQVVRGRRLVLFRSACMSVRVVLVVGH